MRSFDGNYIQYSSLWYFKTLLVQEYRKVTTTHFIGVIEELKCTRSSWKMKLIVGVVFEYDNNYKKV